MAFVIKDRIKETTTTTGTGAIALGGASATFDTFQSVLTNADTTYYAIVHTTSGVDEWEVGLGTWNTGNTLTRTTVISGSNGTSAQNFQAGTKNIFITMPSSRTTLLDASGDLETAVTLGNHNTGGLAEGSNLYYTDARVNSHLSGGTGVTYNDGAISIGQAVATNSTPTFGSITLAADPTTGLQVATKQYVDSIAAAGVHYHDPVRVSIATNFPSTYDNGSSGVGATLTNSGTQAAIVIDGVSLVLNDRVLIKGQTNARHNGVYKVTTVGSGSANWVLTRTTDTDSYGASDKDALGEGDAFFVSAGAVNGGALDVMNVAGTITFGTTEITFVHMLDTTIYSAGTGLTLTGTVFAAAQDITTSGNPQFGTVTANLTGNVTGNVTGNTSGSSGSTTGNAATATALATARTIALSGDVTGNASFDGSGNISITSTVLDDSHAHVVSNVDGLQAALDAKAPTARTISVGGGLTGGGDLTANRTIAHSDTSSQASVDNSGTTFIQDVTIDTYGHVTGLASASLSVGAGGLTQENFTTTLKNKLDAIEASATADQTAAQLLTAIKTVDGASSGLDADLLDGVELSGIVQRTFADTDRNLEIRTPSTGSAGLEMQASDGSYRVQLYGTGSQYGFLDGSWANWDIQKTVNGAFSVDEGAGLVRVFNDGYHPNADVLTTARTINGVSFNGSANITVADSTKLPLAGGTLTGDVTIDSSTTWNAGNGMLNVGGTGDGRVQVRHIWGKASSSAGTDDLWLQYANAGQHVQIGNTGGGNNLYVSGNIYASSYFGTGNLVAVQGASPTFGRITSGGLYGGQGGAIAPIWQYDAGNPGYGIGYSESSPDSFRVDVSGNLMSGTADFEVYPNEARVNGTTVALTNDSRFTNSRTCNNSFDTPATARTNLGLATNSTVTFGTVTATSFTATSDINLKTNIKPISNSMSKLKEINGVEFDWKETGEASVGVIAQDVEKVLPQAVQENDEGVKSVNYNAIIGLLIETVKDQQKQIDRLEKRIN